MTVLAGETVVNTGSTSGIGLGLGILHEISEILDASIARLTSGDAFQTGAAKAGRLVKNADANLRVWSVIFEGVRLQHRADSGFPTRHESFFGLR